MELIFSLQGLGLSGTGLGRLGQALEPLNCVLDASWAHLEGFCRLLEAIWVRLGGFGGRLEGAKAGPSLVGGGFGMLFARFCETSHVESV